YDPSTDFDRVDLNSCVAVLTAGDSFGELGLIRNDVRSAVVITHTACAFLVLDKSAFDRCLRTSIQRQTDDKVARLRAVLPGVRDLRRLIVEQLSYFFHVEKFPKGYTFAVEGERCDSLFLVIEGDCVLQDHRRRLPGDFVSFKAFDSGRCAQLGKIEGVVARVKRLMEASPGVSIAQPSNGNAGGGGAALNETHVHSLHAGGRGGSIHQSGGGPSHHSLNGSNLYFSSSSSHHPHSSQGSSLTGRNAVPPGSSSSSS
ncbi:cyclic nucleotide-binding domain-containing protein, partial [Cystoisospora suis]